MDTISETTTHRLLVLNFWARHGLAVAMVAFGVSRRTLYGWKKAYRDTQGNTAGLNNKSRAPIDRRKRQDWELALLEHLLRLRRRHPALDFEKRHIFLLD